MLDQLASCGSFWRRTTRALGWRTAALLACGGFAFAPAGSLGSLESPILRGARVAYAEERHSPVEARVSAVTAVEQQFFELTNADRLRHGLPPLEYDPSLSEVARWRSADMVAREYFSHDIGGYMVFQVLRDLDIGYRMAGENLAYNHLDGEQTAAAALRALMASPSHRDNILQPSFTHAGVGVARAPTGRYIYTQLFKLAW